MVVLMVAVMASSVAASNGWDSLGNAVGAYVLNQAGQAAADALNRREAVEPQSVGELGVIRIEGKALNGCYVSEMAAALMEEACQNVGFSCASVGDREIVAEEAELGGSPTVKPAEYIGHFTVWQGPGRWSDTMVRGAASRIGLETDSVWAHVSFRVTQQGVEVAAVSADAPDTAISIEAFESRRGHGFEFRTREPTRQDLAVAAACQKAANAAAAKLAPRAAWRFDPESGRPLAREGTCFACGGPLPAGASFCPKCGQDLSRPADACESQDPRAYQPRL